MRAPRAHWGPLFEVWDVRLAGFFLLLAGWAIVVAALAVLDVGTAGICFIFAGFAVEVLGLSLVLRSHRLPLAESL